MNEKTSLSQDVIDLKSSLTALRGSNRTDADWKRMEAQQKVEFNDLPQRYHYCIKDNRNS